MQKKNKYKTKRDFSNTPEPSGNTGKIKKSDPVFVIQKHDAQNLHYDFRLNIEGDLVSWAIPKGLSTKANEKRLAIRTEDHPLDYAYFEGIIPEDQYGGGTVMVWDKGKYEPQKGDKSMKKALEDGALKFILKGKKIKGGYAMAKTGKRGGKDQWMIFKLDDDEADGRRKPTKSEPDSVLSGRSLKEIAEDDSDE